MFWRYGALSDFVRGFPIRFLFSALGIGFTVFAALVVTWLIEAMSDGCWLPDSTDCYPTNRILNYENIDVILLSSHLIFFSIVCAYSKNRRISTFWFIYLNLFSILIYTHFDKISFSVYNLFQTIIGSWLGFLTEPINFAGYFPPVSWNAYSYFEESSLWRIFLFFFASPLLVTVLCAGTIWKNHFSSQDETVPSHGNLLRSLGTLVFKGAEFTDMRWSLQFSVFVTALSVPIFTKYVFGTSLDDFSTRFFAGLAATWTLSFYIIFGLQSDNERRSKHLAHFRVKKEGSQEFIFRCKSKIQDGRKVTLNNCNEDFVFSDLQYMAKTKMEISKLHVEGAYLPLSSFIFRDQPRMFFWRDRQAPVDYMKNLNEVSLRSCFVPEIDLLRFLKDALDENTLHALDLYRTVHPETVEKLVEVLRKRKHKIELNKHRDDLKQLARINFHFRDISLETRREIEGLGIEVTLEDEDGRPMHLYPDSQLYSDDPYR